MEPNEVHDAKSGSNKSNCCVQVVSERTYTRQRALLPLPYPANNVLASALNDKNWFAEPFPAEPNIAPLILV